MTTEKMITVNDIRDSINAEIHRSAWDKGVTAYAMDLLDQLNEAVEGGYFYQDDLNAPNVLRNGLLNGASDWSAYSWGGCSLIYDSDIAERICTASELKKTRNGERKPNSREEWLDVQARALYQAANRIVRHAKKVAEEVEN